MTNAVSLMPTPSKVRTLSKVKMTDAHLHIGLNNYNEEYLLNYLDANSIEKAWVLTWDEQSPVIPMYYLPLDIVRVMKAYENFPDRLVPFYAPDPGRPDWQERLEKYLDAGFAGCGELKVSYQWNDNRIVKLLAFLNERSLPLIFHMEKPKMVFVPKQDKGFDWFFKRMINERSNGRAAHLIEYLSRTTGILKKYLRKRMEFFPGYLQDFQGLDKAIAEHPKVKFIAHGPDIWNNFGSIKKAYLTVQKGKIKEKGLLWNLLELHDNVYCDISGFTAYTNLSRDKKLSKEFFETFHQKILFGTDNWELGHKELIESLDLSDEVKEAVYWKNAKHILQKSS